MKREKTMIDEQRKADLRNRIRQLNQELTPLLAQVKQLQARISGLELDLAEVLDERFQRREFQTKKFEEVRELR
jgi:uncharacterized protein YlxW (UPF0749 family)